MSAQIGVTGLAVMGRNLARNFARNGYTVALHNRTAAGPHAPLVEEYGTRATSSAPRRGGVRGRPGAAPAPDDHGAGGGGHRRGDRASSPRCWSPAT